MVLTEIGEVRVHEGERQHLLRPSLSAMAQIGSPAEIVRVFSAVMADEAHHSQFDEALAVIHACAVDDLGDLFGGHVPDGKKLRYQPGRADPAHIIPLARCLLKHGVTGALPPLPPKPGQEGGEPEYVQEFDARAHAAIAMAHLGASSAEAWAMTMTELVGALRAKYPPQESREPGSRAPSRESMEKTMEWFDRVEAARAGKSGA